MKHRLVARLAAATTLVASALVGVPTAPAHAAVGLYRVRAVSAFDSTSPKTITVNCNAGDKLTTVGGSINNGNGNVLLTRAYADAATMNLATAAGIEAIATAGNWSVEVIAVCAPAGAIANLSLHQATAGPDPNDKVNVTATCPANTVAFGGGIKLDNAFGDVALDELRFASSTTVKGTAYNFGVPGNYSLTVQAMCGTPLPLMSLETFLSAGNSVTPKTETTGVCPANTQVSGVGAVLTGALGNAGITTLNPKVTAGVGESSAQEMGAYANNWTNEVQAICAG